MLGRLDTDIEEDSRKMGRWRQIHRVIATAVTLTLIVLPVATAMKLLGEGNIQTYCLFALTVLAAFDGMFKPAAYSARRRVDAADMTELLWQYRSAVVAAPANDPGRRIAVHDAFRKRYQDLYRQRGQYLVDYGLAQRENDKGKSDASAPAPAGAATTTTTTTTGAPTGAGGATTAATPPAPAPATATGTSPPPNVAKTGASANGDITTGGTP
ncbi:MAG TPA: hypothetical protein VGD80_19795 [Kofleriaceae bacterium]